MKVIHVLKKIDTIDQDIKDLKKLERSLSRDKSFSTPIFMSIEKQINILLGERIKLLELKVDVPAGTTLLVAGKEADKEETRAPEKPAAKAKPKKSKPKKATPEDAMPSLDEIAMLTQTQIDDRIRELEDEREKDRKSAKLRLKEDADTGSGNDESVKLLDIALEKGTLDKGEIEKRKRKVRFFKDNFPGGEY